MKKSRSGSKSFHLTLDHIEEARKVLAPILEPTPLLKNAWLSQSLGCEVYLKLENLQPIGSFKIRGATFRISRLTDSQKKRGVIAASAGNHAQGVAWGAKRLGVSALIVMPESAPLVKIQNTKALGAQVILHGSNYDEAFAHAQSLVRKTKRIYIHAFEDADVISGQGTVALEILEQLPDVDTVIGSMGGGGLMAGVATVFRGLKPEVKLWGCQASGAPSLVEGLKRHRGVRLPKVDTFADGIAVKESKTSMVRLLETLDAVYTADDEAISESILKLLEKAKTVTEASAAITLAIAERQAKELKGKKVVLLISGGNIDVNVLGRVIDRGLIQAGRRLRVRVMISDTPGSLSRLSALIGNLGANILQAIHDRSDLSSGIHSTGVDLTLETKGPHHSRELLKALKKDTLGLDVLH